MPQFPLDTNTDQYQGYIRFQPIVTEYLDFGAVVGGGGSVLSQGKDFFTGLFKKDDSVANAEAEGAGTYCNFIKCDAKAMRAQLDDESFDAIVTNVPWGVQTGNDAKVDLEKLYEMVCHRVRC